MIMMFQKQELLQDPVIMLESWKMTRKYETETQTETHYTTESDDKDNNDNHRPWYMWNLSTSNLDSLRYY